VIALRFVDNEASANQLAALASPALMPPKYLEKSGVDQAVPPALTQVVERFRETNAGAFAMRMYETEREVS
jgi:hypothetical protein